jgi:curved DNA-binding protein CbpA
MKLDSKLFDRIRIKPDPARLEREGMPPCDWAGCGERAPHRAPMGRHREGEYHRFCLAHVKQYNQSYNYFAGMSDASVAAFQRDALTGHRPTWKVGVDQAGSREAASKRATAKMARDPFDLFGGGRGPAPEQAEAPRPVSAIVRRALDTFDIEASATAVEIKARYKLLVKRHHPDANGGDRASEERLRQVIQAYGVLKGAGFC